MGKLRRGGYIFVFFKGDHGPRHVHIYKDGELVAKWNLRDGELMKGNMNSRLRALIDELVREGKL